MSGPQSICFICETPIVPGSPYAPSMVMSTDGSPDMVLSHISCQADVIGAQLARHVLDALETNEVTTIKASERDKGDSLHDTLIALALRALERVRNGNQD